MFGRVFHFAPTSQATQPAAMSPSSRFSRTPPRSTRFDTIGQRTNSEPISRNLSHYLSARDRYSTHTQFH
jgi:hypothetical protein